MAGHFLRAHADISAIAPSCALVIFTIIFIIAFADIIRLHFFFATAAVDAGCYCHRPMAALRAAMRYAAFCFAGMHMAIAAKWRAARCYAMAAYAICKGVAARYAMRAACSAARAARHAAIYMLCWLHMLLGRKVCRPVLSRFTVLPSRGLGVTPGCRPCRITDPIHR